MPGPLRRLLDAPLIGTYLRLRVALLFATVLAVVLGGTAIAVGGVAGTALLLGLVASGVVASLVVVWVR
jgi:ABC-type transport system involved in cytochrome c biogenesis permease component